MTGYLVIDTETNALPDFHSPADAAGQPRLAAFAMLYVDEGLDVEQSVNHLIRPDGWHMTPGAAAVNGLSDVLLSERGVPVATVLDIYTAAVASGRPVLAYNSRHDCKVMRGELRLSGRDDLFERTPNWCIMRAATPVCGFKNVRGAPKWPKLEEACSFFAIERNGQPHVPLSDALTALAVARELVACGVEITPEVHYARGHAA